MGLSGWITACAVVSGSLWLLCPLAFKIQRRDERDGFDKIRTEYDPPSGADFEIVAVHGLGAHPKHTWEGKSTATSRSQSPQKFHLLSDLLPNDFPKARILSFSYNSDWLINAPMKTAQNIGESLLDAFLSHRKQTGQRLPIVFIGHSFGGIVIKQALCVPKCPSQILEDICGVIFLGTPHQGSRKSAAAVFVARLTGFLGSNTMLLKALQSQVSELCDVEDSFRSLVREQWPELGSKIISFRETMPTVMFGWFSLGLVVDANSAAGVSARTINVGSNHSTLNKFDGPGNTRYDELKKVICNLRESSLLQKADDHIRKEHYTDTTLEITRLSGKSLEMDQCYINLAIVKQLERETPSQSRPKGEDSVPQSSPFSLLARQKVEMPEEQTQVQLADIFKLCEGPGPRRILIRGRAGVGKTTLCKKMVQDFIKKDIWNDLFDRVLWVPLRNLKGRHGQDYNLQTLFEHQYFWSLSEDGDRRRFAEEIHGTLKDKRTLFILDGWDEVERTFDSGSDMSRFLRKLLDQDNIIITSRPSASVPISDKKESGCVELETIGFSPDQVDNYIEKVHKENVDEIKSFLQNHQLVRSLVRIPIQLDAFCLCWMDINGDREDNREDNREDRLETMTQLYQAIQTSLWKKDIPRLNEKVVGLDLKTSDQQSVESHVGDELRFLEQLAFTGLVADKVEFDLHDRNNVNKIANPGTPILLDKILPCLSFLRTSNLPAEKAHQSYHFIHLTFQEYFAARYFVRHWNENILSTGLVLRHNSDKGISPAAFFQEHKYTARYNVMWRFVAGLLDAKAEGESTRFFKEIEKEPVDLLGPAHQRLVMHCMGETVHLPSKVREDREERTRQWVLFEIEFTGFSYLARERELPEKVLQLVLDVSERRQEILEALVYSGRHLSEATTTALVALLTDENTSVRSSAARVLGKQSTLSEANTTALVALFKDKDWLVRSLAAEALGEQSTLSEANTTTLVALLKDKDSSIRYSTAKALGKQSTVSEAITTVLVALFKDEDSSVRVYAAEALGKQSTLSDATTTALVALLKDEHSSVRSSAARAVGKQSTLSEANTTALVALFKDKDWSVRYSAAEALGKQSTLSEANMTALVALFKDKDSSVRYSAARALGKQSTLSDAITTALVALLKDEHSSIRSFAATALGEQSTLSEAITTALVALFKDKDSSVRSSAARALGKQSTLSEANTTALVALFKDKDSSVRYSAATALGEQSTLSDATTTALVALFKDEDSSVRVYAAEALGKQSTLSEAITTALVALFKDKDSSVRSSAAATLGKQSTLSEANTTALIALFKDKHSSVRSSAARALGKQSTLSDANTTALIALFKDKHSSIRSSAARALSKKPTLSEANTTALIAFLKDKHSSVRSSAAQALGKQSTLSEANTTALIALLKDEHSSVRSSAARALGKQSTLSDAITTALVALLKDEHSSVRSSAARALGKQSTLSEANTTALIALLKDEHSSVRSSAARAVGKQSTLSDTNTTALVALLTDENTSVRSSAARVLGKQSTLSDATTTALVALLKDKHSSVRSSAAEALGKQPNLMDNILEALELPLESETRLTFHNPQHMEYLYQSLLWRSFREQFSLYSRGNVCIINQTSGFRKADFEDGKTLRDAISNGQFKLREKLSYNIWAPLEGENEAD